MRATFTDEQQQLQEVAADIAASGRPEPPQPHERVAEATGTTRALLDGFAGLAVPEDAGGMGGELVDLAIVAHELGRNVVATPFLSHVLAVQVALAAGLDVTAPAAGRVRWTLASDEAGADPLGPWQASGDPVGGTKLRVPDAEGVDAFVATVGEDGLVVASGTATADAGMDLARPSFGVDLAGDAEAGTGRGAAAGIFRALPVLSAELVGVGRGAVETATAYAKEREQFGQPIGRFQGVSFQLADALVAVEEAWSLALYAAWAIDADAADARRAVHTAKAAAADAAVFAAERGTQVHGGIGITWEAMPHLFLRRAVTAGPWLGDAGWHRRQVGRELLAG